MDKPKEKWLLESTNPITATRASFTGCPPEIGKSGKSLAFLFFSAPISQCPIANQ